MKRKPLKVAIVGNGATKDRAPIWDHSWEIWALNSTPLQRVTRRFELHRRHHLLRDFGAKGLKKYLAAVGKDRPRPIVYVWQPEDYPELHATPYPLALVRTLPRGGEYHAWSPDWMLALAIALKAKAIALYGIEPTHTAEPISARPCTEYWLGVAAGRGIQVTADLCSIFRIYSLHTSSALYGFDDWRMLEVR